MAQKMSAEAIKETHIAGGKRLAAARNGINRDKSYSVEDAVKLVKQGMKKHWWHPLDEDLQRALRNGKAQHKKPVEGPMAADTGEGTRYGRRPKHPDKAHVHPPRKPQQ